MKAGNSKRKWSLTGLGRLNASLFFFFHFSTHCSIMQDKFHPGRKNMNCNVCGQQMKYYDSVKRIRKKAYGQKEWTLVPRYYCPHCSTVHRVLPFYLLPFKHYERVIIEGLMDKQLSTNMTEYEDYPCDSTIIKWRSQKKQRI